MSEPLLLVGAGSAAAGAEFHLARIAAAHPVVLVDTTAPAWARPYLLKHIAADLDHFPDTADAVMGYTSRQDVCGVLSHVPDHLVTASRLADRLGLPAVSAEALAVLSDATALRGLLARHHICQPRVPAAVDGHPDGPVISAETVVLPDGDIRIVAVTRTALGSTSGREVTRHSVYAHDSLLHNPLVRQTVQRVVRAVGLTFGVLHIGMKLTALGPRVTDVQARLADDLIPLLVKRATGVDLPLVSAALATGRTPDLTPTRQAAAAVRFAHPSLSGRIEHLDVSPEAARQPLLECMGLLQQPGNHVLAPPEGGLEDRLAYWVVSGPGRDHCDAALDDMARHLSVGITAAAVSGQAA
ncbi:hypothetical protein ACFY71_09780 [Streptomyces cinerochromogenes]|uniref:hypothetical protein n=1 Tax=Streptomyces cinerochromogenes TaxID=66422 RepID=UPI003687ACA4